jgi:hypothetical protein
MKKHKKPLVILLVLIILSLACGELTIYNNSVYPVRVIVKLPDGNGTDSIVLKGGGAATYYSDTDGSYTVTAVLDEDAVNEMIKLRSNLQGFLVDPEIEELTGISISDSVKELLSISDTIQSKYKVSCSGVLKEDEEATASISVPDQQIKIWCH